MTNHRENGNRDPRGNHGGNPDAWGQGDQSRSCPFCKKFVGQLPNHLPCDGPRGDQA